MSDTAPSRASYLLHMFQGWWTILVGLALGSSLMAAFEVLLLALFTSVVLLLAGDETIPSDLRWLEAVLPTSMEGRLAVGLMAAAGRAGLQVGIGWARARFVAAYVVSLRTQLMRAWLGAPWRVQSGFSSAEFSNLLTPTTKGCARAAFGTSSALEGVGACVVLALGAFALSPMASVILLVIGLGLALAQRPLVLVAIRLATRTSEALQGYGRRLGDTLEGSEEVRAYGVQREVGQWLETSNRDLAKMERAQAFVQEITPAMFHNLATLGLLLCVAGLVWFEVSVLLSIPALVVLFRAMRRGQGVSRQVQVLSEGVGWHMAFREALDTLSVRDAASGSVAIGEVAQVDMDGVVYRYPDGAEALSGVTLSFKRGEVIGIAGASGAGKTTLMELILGLRQPTEGSLHVNDEPLVNVSPQSWREQLRYVPQLPLMFDGTVRDNIRFMRDELSDAAIESASVRAGLAKERLEQEVGTGGRSLSGGQRQRVALARSLAGGSGSVLVMDEPTSALDSHTESFVHRAFRELAEEHMVLIISHRAATLMCCDRVVVLSDGVVKAQGPWDQVAELCGGL